jgi:hypothetical protein
MATLNVGAMAARLGLDPSDFLDKMKGVQGFNGFVSGEMARQWKKTGRDGQEGLRLIDEALGIHVARPVARIVSETFPALGKAMSSVLPTVAFGALGYAIFEFGEQVAQKMTEAKKKEEEYSDAVRKTQTVYAESAAQNEHSIDAVRAKLAGLKGDASAEFKFKIASIDSQNLADLAKQVDALTDAERREAAAAAERMGVWAKMAEIWHGITATDAQLGTEKIDAQVKAFQEHFADLARTDGLAGTTKAADYLNQQLAEAKKTLDQMHADAGKLITMPSVGMGAAPLTRALVTPEQIAGEEKYFDALKKSQALQQQIVKEKGDAEKEAAKIEAGAAHARELRTEIEAVQRLASSSQALASSEELAAAATAKGSAASIQAAAAAEAQKKIQDLIAEADTKFFSNTQQKIAATKQFQAALASAIPIIRAAALSEQTSKALEEYNRNVGELTTRSKERIAALEGEASAHGKVASEQAKELAGLIPLEEKLKALKDLAGGPAPAIGPPTANQAHVAEATAALAAARANIEQYVNPKIQTAAFSSELHKIQDEMKSLASGEISPWAKMDAEVVKLTRDLALTPPQIEQLRGALAGVQNVKIAGEFEKLAHQIELARVETTALSSASPFAKLDAEAQKLGREFGLLPPQIAQVRSALMELQSVENVGKAWLSVDNLNAAGAKMQELRQQMDALGRAQSTGRTDDGVSLSPDALAAVKLEMLDIAEEENKIALKTGDVNAGFQAWAVSLQKTASAGEVTFDALTQATKGFEDAATNSLMAIMTANRNQHQKLIQELDKMWSQYFDGLAKMAMKRGMDQLLAPLGKAITGGPGGQNQNDVQKQLAAGPGALFPGLLKSAGAAGGPGATGAASLTSAGTVLHSAATELLSAAAALRSSAGMPGAGGGSGPFASAGAGDDTVPNVPMFAEGGDATPGSSFISGEAGAEQVDLDRSGGAHITPLGFGTKSGDTHVYQDFTGAVVTDDLMRRADAAHMMKASESRMMQAMPAMQREINLRKRD